MIAPDGASVSSDALRRWGCMAAYNERMSESLRSDHRRHRIGLLLSVAGMIPLLAAVWFVGARTWSEYQTRQELPEIVAAVRQQMPVQRVEVLSVDAMMALELENAPRRTTEAGVGADAGGSGEAGSSHGSGSQIAAGVDAETGVSVATGDTAATDDTEAGVPTGDRGAAAEGRGADEEAAAEGSAKGSALPGIDLGESWLTEGNPVTSTPAVTADGHMNSVPVEHRDYVGILEIPSLDLELPVMLGVDSAPVPDAPNAWHGSVYTDSLVIGAVNYKSQFGRLAELRDGAHIMFTDMLGQRFHYRVAGVGDVPSDDGAALRAKPEPWDLTLFTPSFSGIQRILVRAVAL